MLQLWGRWPLHVSAELPRASVIKTRNWPHWISLLMLLGLVPAVRSQHLPVRFDWVTLSVAYWLVLSAQSIFVAALLAMIAVPGALSRTITRLRNHPSRIVAVLAYFIILFFAAGASKAIVLTVDTIAVMELLAKKDGSGRNALRSAAAVVPPAAYLFFGFLMMLAYNYAIVSARCNFAYDAAFDGIDHRLLFGHSISQFTHWAVGVFPLPVFRAMQFVYFGMFPQIGAAILMLALCEGRNRALQYVGTILLSYYLALALFYLWPAIGPFYLCPDHFSRFPASLQVYNIQKTLIRHSLSLWHHETVLRISTDYFIGFPCMHIVQPLIVLWFLRPWKRMVLILAAYDIVLTAAIFLLEMHYAIDYLAGILLAAVAIVIAGGPYRRAVPLPQEAAG